MEAGGNHTYVALISCRISMCLHGDHFFRGNGCLFVLYRTSVRKPLMVQGHRATLIAFEEPHGPRWDLHSSSPRTAPGCSKPNLHSILVFTRKTVDYPTTKHSQRISATPREGGEIRAAGFNQEAIFHRSPWTRNNEKL